MSLASKSTFAASPNWGLARLPLDPALLAIHKHDIWSGRDISSSPGIELDSQTKMRLFKWPQFVFKQTATELSAWRKTVSTFNGRALLAFVALYLLALADCRHSLARDPTSLFFDPIESYRPQYSSVRREQALNYVAHGGHPNLEHAAKLPTTCVGIATFKRPGEQYVKAAIGSLLEGLRDHERRDVYFLILIANTDPLEHPIYGERDGWKT